MSDEIKVKKPFWKKWWFWVIVVLVLIGAAGQGGKKDQAASNGAPTTATSQESEKKEPVEKITALALDAAYKENEVAADQKYKGKTLEISGEIESINKDAFDGIYLAIKSNNQFESVHFNFPKESTDKVSQLKKGQKITVQGKVSGMTIGSVIVKDCSIVE